MNPSLTSTSPSAAGASHVDAARRAVAPRALATLLLAAGVAALAVVTERLIDTWADGHLLAAWVLMWAVVFLGSLLLASPARHAAHRAMAALNAWALRRARARAEARTQALARHDARLQAELAAMRLRQETPAQAWARALAPLGPEISLPTREQHIGAASPRGLAAFPSGQRYRLFYV
ncbi:MULTISPECIES: hypothetical protein [unclassified Tepidimonas]|jgi:hypothetical protein|uniref:hypothetical protein n=1 Tax=unclassified Tepidimonas TaxID=2631705 RepID=UPI003C7CA441